MSYDYLYVVESGGKFIGAKCDDKRFKEVVKLGHLISQMRSGMLGLFAFVNAEEATNTFEKWRREPCESITLMLNGVEQEGDRLPLTQAQLEQASAEFAKHREETKQPLTPEQEAILLQGPDRF